MLCKKLRLLFSYFWGLKWIKRRAIVECALQLYWKRVTILFEKDQISNKIEVAAVVMYQYSCFMLSLSHDYTKPKTDVESQRTKKEKKNWTQWWRQYIRTKKTNDVHIFYVFCSDKSSLIWVFYGSCYCYTYVQWLMVR